MAHTHTIDFSGLLGGGRQVMLLDDEVPIEPFEGTTFPRPARVHLEIRNVDRLLHIEGEIDALAQGPCDGCLEDVERQMHVAVDERIDPYVGRDDDPFGESNVVAGTRLDVADLVQQVLLSDMPMGLRCSDNCKGLCGICGSNKNTSECSCNTDGDRSGKSQVEDTAQ
jgi:uncharacterized protein